MTLEINTKNLTSRILLSTFAFYLITGNALRLIHIPGSNLEHNLLVTEIVLFFLCLLSLFVLRIVFSSTILWIISAIIGSAFYGTISHGLDMHSILFSIRLIAQILSGIIIGELLFEKFGTSVLGLLKYFDRIYFTNLLIGFALYVIFFRAINLWVLLRGVGIWFDGDGHVGRFVSPYFDPNYFAVIGSIPFIIRHQLQKYTPSLKLFLPPLAIVLTWSRSGIATFVLVLLCILWTRLWQTKHLWMRPKTLFYCIFCLILCRATLWLCQDQFDYFFHRFVHMSQDPSAWGRLTSLLFGLEILLDHPMLGVGYNYLTLYLRDTTGHSGLDSSFMSLAVNFGIPLFSLFLFYLVYWLFHFIRQCRMYRSENPLLYTFSTFMVCYLLICVFFASHWNLLLVYQFWLMPMIAIFTYLRRCLRTISRAT